MSKKADVLSVVTVSAVSQESIVKIYFCKNLHLKEIPLTEQKTRPRWL